VSQHPDTVAAPGVTVLVDDTRDFKDGRPALTARTSADALALLDRLAGSHIDDLWLDYNLVGDDTVQPVVDRLIALDTAGTPLAVSRIHVHSSNIRHGHRICVELVAAGYPARRSYAAGMWVRARWQGPLP
jgi:hypothetical protein